VSPLGFALDAHAQVAGAQPPGVSVEESAAIVVGWSVRKSVMDNLLVRRSLDETREHAYYVVYDAPQQGDPSNSCQCRRQAMGNRGRI